MADEAYTKYVDWSLLRYQVLLFSCMVEASKVEHSASYVVGCWWLLAAVFVSAASTPHLGAFEAGGHHFRTAAVNKKILVGSIRAIN